MSIAALHDALLQRNQMFQHAVSCIWQVNLHCMMFTSSASAAYIHPALSFSSRSHQRSPREVPVASRWTVNSFSDVILLTISPEIDEVVVDESSKLVGVASPCMQDRACTALVSRRSTFAFNSTRGPTVRRGWQSKSDKTLPYGTGGRSSYRRTQGIYRSFCRDVQYAISPRYFPHEWVNEWVDSQGHTSTIAIQCWFTMQEYAGQKTN